MTDLSTGLAEPETPEYSTRLDAPRPSDETVSTKAPETEVKPDPKLAKESRLEAIERAAKDVAPAKEEPEKVEAPAKEADATKESEAKPEEAKEAAPKPEDRPREKNHIDPPAKFLPRSKELWINTPREVKADVQRVIAEAEAEVSTHREAAKEYESIKPFAEMAKAGGTTLDAALGAYTRMEQTLRSNPTEGFRGLLDNMQITPVQAIGHVLAAYGVRPEQLLRHMSENPAAYTPQQQPQIASRQPQQERQPDPEVAALKSELSQIREQMTAAQIIEPFAAENPRYYELQEDIAFFLNSGKVPTSLSPSDRLAAAYDMAVRLSPPLQRQPAPAQEDQAHTTSRAGEDFGGTKSVRGAPASGVETTSARRGKLSRTDALKAAMSELGIAN